MILVEADDEMSELHETSEAGDADCCLFSDWAIRLACCWWGNDIDGSGNGWASPLTAYRVGELHSRTYSFVGSCFRTSSEAGFISSS